MYEEPEDRRWRERREAEARRPRERSLSVRLSRTRTALLAAGMVPCPAEGCGAVADPDEGGRCQLHRCRECDGPARHGMRRGKPCQAYCSTECATAGRDREEGPCAACRRPYSAHRDPGWATPRECAAFRSGLRPYRGGVPALALRGYDDDDMANLDPFGSRGVCREAYGE